MEQQVVTLKNGAEVFSPAVAATMMALQHVLRKHPVAFYELVMKVRDPEHRLFGNAAEILRANGLLEGNGRPHDIICDVVLSAVTGEGFNLFLTSPYAEP